MYPFDEDKTMAIKCSTPECREDLKKCISSKLDVKTLILCMAIIAGICGTVGTMVYGSYAQRQDTQSGNIKSNTESARKVEGDIGKIQTDLEWIKKGMEESKLLQTEILHKLDNLKGQLTDK